MDFNIRFNLIFHGKFEFRWILNLDVKLTDPDLSFFKILARRVRINLLNESEVQLLSANRIHLNVKIADPTLWNNPDTESTLNSQYKGYFYCYYNLTLVNKYYKKS